MTHEKLELSYKIASYNETEFKAVASFPDQWLCIIFNK